MKINITEEQRDRLADKIYELLFVYDLGEGWKCSFCGAYTKGKASIAHYPDCLGYELIALLEGAEKE